jgi:hypothetical protein
MSFKQNRIPSRKAGFADVLEMNQFHQMPEHLSLPQRHINSVSLHHSQAYTDWTFNKIFLAHRKCRAASRLVIRLMTAISFDDCGN